MSSGAPPLLPPHPPPPPLRSLVLIFPYWVVAPQFFAGTLLFGALVQIGEGE